MDEPIDQPPDERRTSDSTSSVQDLLSPLSPLSPTAAEKMSDEKEATAVDPAPQHETESSVEPSEQLHAPAVSEQSQLALSLPSTPSDEPAAPADLLEQLQPHNEPTGAQEALTAQDDADNNTAASVEQTRPAEQLTETEVESASCDDAERHVAGEPADRSAREVDQIRSANNDLATAGDSANDDVTAVRLSEQPVTHTDTEQLAPPQQGVAGAEGSEQQTAVVFLSAAAADNIVFAHSPQPRTALHTAVPNVLTTFLTATDDLSSTPTPDTTFDDTPLDHSLPINTAQDDQLQTTAAYQPPATAYPPSSLIPSLSTAALESLLSFRSTGSSLSALSSSSSLTVALRDLKHVLDHPLLAPARPDGRRGYEFETLSKPKRTEAAEARRSSKQYGEMGGKKSEHDKLHHRLQAELASIQQESSALAAHYPLDPLNASMLQPGEGANVMRLPKKERVDYMSAEHSRAINRVQRYRQKFKEDEAMNDLIHAVSSPSPHILPPLPASARSMRLPAGMCAITMQPSSPDALWS